nr:sodium/proline symporter PutP [Clostridia bacterium]
MIGEIIAFVVYFAAMIAVGFIIMAKSKDDGESGYFLGGRKMGPFVTGLSAQASDMSGWLLMGLPGSILVAGFGEVWVAIGLAIGSYLAWLLIAKRLRIFSEKANNAITIPQYLNNRFRASNKALQIVCAVIFFVCFTVYVASGFKAGATLFKTVFNLDMVPAMIIFGLIIVLYTFTGGFKAVCYTDFFQALLMLAALVITPIAVVLTTDMSAIGNVTNEVPNYFNFLPSGKFDGTSVKSIISGLAWGLGYFGMPHIIVRFMSIDSASKIKTSRRVATTWVVITLAMAAVIGIVGRIALPELASNGEQELVFIKMVRNLFPSFISGLLLSAILAAAMSTADSQLLVASSAFTSDIYKPIIKKDATDKEILWIGRIVVIAISIAAFFIAIAPGAGSIMDLVSNAWAGFGAAFGPVIVLSLYWKRITYPGALAGIVAGAVTVVVWIAFLSGTGIYELFPGFIVGMAATVIGSLLSKKPSAEVEKMFDEASAAVKAE